MKFIWNKTAVWMFAALGMLTACSDDDNGGGEEDNGTVVTTTDGVYVINTGNWGMNNGTVQWYDPETKVASSDLYEAANGKGIGDVQDLIVYGTKVYITCSTSAKIEIVNQKDFTIAQTINLANSSGEAIEPRYLTAADGYVYFSAYDGTVSKIDTTSLSITKTIEVGAYPEALTTANGKLYVNISGYGSGSTVAVVDLESFTKSNELNVVLDPYDTSFTADDGLVYIISVGDYGKSTHATLQCINPDTDTVTEICNASKAAIKDNKVYYIYSEYYSSTPGVIGVYDMDTQTSTEFVSFSDFANPNFIAVDPVSGDVYIGDYSYTSLNDVYVYSSDGTLKDSFESGYYTTNVRFVTSTTTVK